jgi:DNA-binding NtrC family response regulator
MFRLDVFPVRVPALRERPGDIPLLADAFVAAFCKENGLRPKRIDPSLYEALSRRKWPGNVRELKNVVERAAILSSDVITVADLPEDPHSSPFEDENDDEPSVPSTPLDPSRGRLTLREHRDAAERAYILETLKELSWNISRASVVLGVERTNLHK